MKTFRYKFELDVLNTLPVILCCKHKILQRIYGLISVFAS